MNLSVAVNDAGVLVAQRPTQRIRCDLELRAERSAGHVVEQGTAKLAGRVAPGQVRGNVASANENAATVNLRLEDEAEPAVGEPVVDDLNQRGNSGGQFIHHQCCCTMEKLPPLPVAVGICREGREQRMARVTQQTQYVRGLFLRPRGR